MKTLIELVPELKTSLIQEAYPHIANNLVEFWGTSYFNEYVSLLGTTHRNNRAGFAFPILMEIQKIIDAHGDKFPHYRQDTILWV